MGWIADFVVVPRDRAQAILEDPERFDDEALSYDTVVDQNRMVILWAVLEGREIPNGADVTTLLGDDVWLVTLAEGDDAWVFEVPEPVVQALSADDTDVDELAARWERAGDALGFGFDGDVAAADVLQGLRPLCKRARTTSATVVMHEWI